MTQSEVTTARIIFYVAAIANVIYGLLFLSMPERVFELSQDPGVPANPGWVRGCADPKPTLRDSENHGFECPAPQLFSVGHALGG